MTVLVFVALQVGAAPFQDGLRAAGAGMVGPNLKEAAGWSYVLFKRAMLQGKDDKGVVFKAPMPVWGKVGFAGDHGKAPTDAELKALQAYLNTLKFK